VPFSSGGRTCVAEVSAILGPQTQLSAPIAAQIAPVKEQATARTSRLREDLLLAAVQLLKLLFSEGILRIHF
jgi:hypothetical protein